MTLADFEPLTEAEEAVIAGLGTGHVTVLGDGKLPDPEAGDDRRVRASLIRWLALGAPGDAAVRLHEHGLRIKGALVVSDGQADPVLGEEATPGLDLEGGRLDQDLLLLACRFQDTPVLRGAKLETLNLQGSHLPGLEGDGLEARRDVSLQNVHAEGEVRLLGARIGGDLDCIGGQFENIGERALNAAGARVVGAFFWRSDYNGNRAAAKGALDLTAADIGHVNDDPACWPGPGDLLLNRCTYAAFTGHGITADNRIRWLDLLDPARVGKDFWPQPWEHCAQVLREMGHSDDARQVLIAKEERQRRVWRAQAASDLSKVRRRIAKVERDADPHDIEARLAAWSGLVGAWSTLAFLRLRDWLLSALIAYGHRPLRALGWLAGMWLVGAVLFGVVHGNGGFKPNNAFVLSKPAWFECAVGGDRRSDHPSTLACYQSQPAAAGYPAFNAALYSLDTLVPVVDLEVQDYWVPDERVSPAARYYLWVHIAMGWFLALLAVAGVSGLIDTRATKG
jgi:hypothetical protein